MTTSVFNEKRKSCVYSLIRGTGTVCTADEKECANFIKKEFEPFSEEFKAFPNKRKLNFSDWQEKSYIRSIFAAREYEIRVIDINLKHFLELLANGKLWAAFLHAYQVLTQIKLYIGKDKEKSRNGKKSQYRIWYEKRKRAVEWLRKRILYILWQNYRLMPENVSPKKTDETFVFRANVAGSESIGANAIFAKIPNGNQLPCITDMKGLSVFGWNNGGYTWRNDAYTNENFPRYRDRGFPLEKFSTYFSENKSEINYIDLFYGGCPSSYVYSGKGEDKKAQEIAKMIYQSIKIKNAKKNIIFLTGFSRGAVTIFKVMLELEELFKPTFEFEIEIHIWGIDPTQGRADDLSIFGKDYRLNRLTRDSQTYTSPKYVKSVTIFRRGRAKNPFTHYMPHPRIYKFDPKKTITTVFELKKYGHNDFSEDDNEFEVNFKAMSQLFKIFVRLILNPTERKFGDCLRDLYSNSLPDEDETYGDYYTNHGNTDSRDYRRLENIRIKKSNINAFINPNSRYTNLVNFIDKLYKEYS